MARRSREGNALTVAAPCGGTIVKLLVKNAGHRGAKLGCPGRDRLPRRAPAGRTDGAAARARTAARGPAGEAALRRVPVSTLRRPLRDAALDQPHGVTAPNGHAGGVAFRALADLDEQTLRIGGQPLAVLPGMGGQASIVVGRRSLASYAIEPLRTDARSDVRERPAPASGGGRVSVPPRHVSYTSRDATLDDFVSTDPPMQACLERARLAARTDLPVLILGESGTGKTILARAIHNSSARAAGPFVSFNAAALSETLIDSQLFGHERGAFTGAQQRSQGQVRAGRSRHVVPGRDRRSEPAGTEQDPARDRIRRVRAARLRDAAAGRRARAVGHPPSGPPRSTKGTAVPRRPLLSHQRRHASIVPPLRARPRDLPDAGRQRDRARQPDARQVDRRTRSRGGRPAVRVPLAGQPPRALEGRAGRRRAHDRVRHCRRGLVASGRSRVVPDASCSSGRRPTRATDLAAAQGRHSTHVRFVMQHAQGNKRRAARELGVSRETLARRLREIAATKQCASGSAQESGVNAI